MYFFFCVFFFFKQKTAYEMRISDWSSDVCSSDLLCSLYGGIPRAEARGHIAQVAFPEAQILQRKTALAGEGIGYNATRTAERDKIGRASCRERVCQYV